MDELNVLVELLLFARSVIGCEKINEPPLYIVMIVFVETDHTWGDVKSCNTPPLKTMIFVGYWNANVAPGELTNGPICNLPYILIDWMLIIQCGSLVICTVTLLGMTTVEPSFGATLPLHVLGRLKSPDCAAIIVSLATNINTSLFHVQKIFFSLTIIR